MASVSKAEKVFLIVYFALLLICVLFYKPLEQIFLNYIGIWIGAEFYHIGMLFGLAAAIFILCDSNWASKLKDRWLSAFLFFIFSSLITTGILQGVSWVIEHVRII